MNDNEWREECAYVSRLADLRGMVPEMDFSILVCIHYAHMMQSKATREGFYDAATYIGECLDDMIEALNMEGQF